MNGRGEIQPIVLLAVITPPAVVWLAQLKGHMRGVSRAIDRVDWSWWLTAFVWYVSAPKALIWIFRNARPGSWWANRFYDSQRLEESRSRYWEDLSDLLTSSNMQRKRRIRRSIGGYERDQVDRYLDRTVDVLQAFELQNPHRVVIPEDLLAPPKLRNARIGYEPRKVDELLLILNETLIRLDWLQRSRPWLLNGTRFGPPA